MTKLLLLFKHPSKPAEFESRYRHNLDLLRRMPGILAVEENEVVGSPTGQTAYARFLEITFADFAALDAALTSPEGNAAGADLMSFAAQDVELLFVETANEKTQTALKPENLQAYLDEHTIPAEIVYPGKFTPTVPAAARALNVEPDQIVKSVVFLVDGKPYLVYGCGTQRIDSRKLAERLNVHYKKIRLARAEEVLQLTGYAVGTVPPLGLRTPMPTFMVPEVQNYDTIYAGGGGINALLKMASADLLRISGAEIAPLLAASSKVTPHE